MGRLGQVTHERQVHLGNVIAVLLWVAAWGMMILAAVLDMEQIAWPGMAVVGMASVASARSYLAEHDRHTQRALALRDEADRAELRRVR